MKIWVIVALALYPCTQQSSTSSSSEPVKTDALIDSKTIMVNPGRKLVLEPGIRATKSDLGYTLATYDGSKVEIVTSEGRLALLSPVNAQLNETTWGFGNGKASSDAVLIARRAVQDDTDTNLKSMQESAKKLKSKKDETNNDKTQTGKKLRVRWLFGENPMPTAELFNSAAIQQMTHLSAIGF